MQTIDWVILVLFFVVLLVVGALSAKKVRDSSDFFVAGGKMPWWLAGVSHHVSGYSGVVFVGYAAIAYTHGITIYVWWALTIAVGTAIGAFLIAPKWAELRRQQGIQSPTEYLLGRYGLATQQLVAWSGVLLKLFDVGAKWTAIAILLNSFTGLPMSWGILLSGGISMIYVTLGGLWADIRNDFIQFIVQLAAGLVMLWMVIRHLGGWTNTSEAWMQLPAENRALFHDPYGPTFFLAFLMINFLSYNGGTWNLALRFISTAGGPQARKAALLSAGLYFIWPLILFVPMWLAPVLLPNLSDPQTSYAELVHLLMPAGLVGLILASMFSNTMTMTASDSNAVSAVITRDILPWLRPDLRNLPAQQSMILARTVTFTFTICTLVIAWNAGAFGGVLGLIIAWFGALLGPIAIPVLFGLLPAFRHCGQTAAIAAILGGLLAFALAKTVFAASLPVQVGAPVLTAFLLYVVVGKVRARV